MSDLKNRFIVGLQNFLIKYRKTRKFITKSFLMSITLLAILLGINSDIISQYEDAKQTEFNWLNPLDILRFPIDQLKYNYQTRVEKLDLEYEKNDSLHFVFLLDRTSSSQTGPETTNSSNAKEAFIEDVKEDYTNDNEDMSDIEKLDYQTLMCLLMIKYITKEITGLYQDVKITVAYNDGGKDLNFVGNVKTIKVDDKSLEYYARFFKINERQNVEKERTYFDKAFEELFNESNRHRSSQKIFTVMSDFGHDKHVDGLHSYKDIHKILNKFDPNIQMNLIRYPLSKGTDKERFNYKPKELIEYIKSVFKSTYVYNLDINTFEKKVDKGLRTQKIKEFVTPTVTAESKDIYMVFPDINRQNNGVYNAAVELSLEHAKPKDNDMAKFFLSYSVVPWQHVAVPMEYEVESSTQKGWLDPNFSSNIELEKDQKIRLKIPVNKTPHPIQLDIYSEDQKRKTRYNIRIVERASAVVSQIHFLFAGISILSLLSFIALVLVYLFKNRVVNGVIILLVIILPFILVYCLFDLFYNGEWLFICTCIFTYAIYIMICFSIYWIDKYNFRIEHGPSSYNQKHLLS